MHPDLFCHGTLYPKYGFDMSMLHNPIVYGLYDLNCMDAHYSDLGEASNTPNIIESELKSRNILEYVATLERRLAVLERNRGVEGDVGAPTMDAEIVSEAKEKEDPIAAPPVVQPIKLFQREEDVEHSTSSNTHPKSLSRTTSATQVFFFYSSLHA